MAQEKNFENKLKKYLEMHGAWFIKYWAGPRYTKEGIPDILACITGKFYGIELKSNYGRPKLTQLVNLRKIRAAGGIGLLLYPDNFKNFVEFITKGNEAWYQENIKLQNLWFDRLNQ